MPVLPESVRKAQAVDSNFQYYGLTVTQMMESVGRTFAEQLQKDFGSGKKVHIFCGLGNNGGDGFVMARYLAPKNSVQVTLLGTQEQISTDEAFRNFIILKNTNTKINFVESPKQLPKKIDSEIIVDAIIGSGIKGNLKEPVQSAVNLINKSKAKKVALDIPTHSLEADKVYCLITKKHSKGILLEFGAPKEFHSYTGPGNVKLLKKPKKGSKKGDNGKTLVIGGSKKFHGALIFAAKAATYFSDLVFVLSVKENLNVAKKTSPNFIASELNKKNAQMFAERADSIVIGPGLEVNSKNKALVNFLLKKFKNKKFVLDAGALHLLDKKLLHKNIVLTPHRTEFEKTFKLKPNAKNVKTMAKKYKCTIVLKAPADIISNGSKVFYNHSGNEKMTAGGTGDLVAGTIGAFSATNSPMDSALAGIFLTGFAGDLVKEKQEYFNSENVLFALPFARKICDEN